MNTKKITITLLVLALLVPVTIFGVKAVSANNNSTYPPLIQKLVDHFNLNRDEVEQVFDQHRQERQQQMKTRLEERLNQAVSDGKITKKQKIAILAKIKEIKDNDHEFWNLSVEKRQEIRKQHKEEIRTWAEKNDIDLSLFHHLTFFRIRPFR